MELRSLYEQYFQERLTQLRHSRGVSARDMSLSLGQNSGYINHIEKQQALPSLTVFSIYVNIFILHRNNFSQVNLKILNL